VLAALVIAILGLALYPQLVLKRTDASTTAAVTAAKEQPPAKLALRQ
jgi:NADH:ubiquinone oxidoreductase subunit 4 (subunit M)